MTATWFMAQAVGTLHKYLRGVANKTDRDWSINEKCSQLLLFDLLGPADVWGKGAESSMIQNFTFSPSILLRCLIRALSRRVKQVHPEKSP